MSKRPADAMSTATTVKSTVRLFGGVLQRLTHASTACKCDMTFAVYLPPQAEKAPVPSLYWLSGLTCTDENFSQKSGFARAAAARCRAHHPRHLAAWRHHCRRG